MKRSSVKVVMPKSMMSKLTTAVSMLLISAILMVGTTYAWFVMSTAPEVSGITTQVGANGSLEIALLSTESYNDLSLIDMADFDESAASTVQSSNLTWGNLVSLGDSAYGLDKIVLMPARLNIAQNGDGYKIGATLLKTPKYGDDGRIQSLQTIAVSSTYQSGLFPASDGSQSYGVRAIGTSSQQSAYQLAIISARNTLATETAAARTTASNTLNFTGGALGNIVVKYALDSNSSTYTKEDIQAMKDLAVGLQESLAHIEKALRQVYAAYIVSEKFEPEEEWNYEEALVEIETAELSVLNGTYSSTGVTNMATYVNNYNDDKTAVDYAISQCDEKLNSGSESFTWDDIVTTMNPLVDYQRMTINGKTVSEVKAMTNDLGQIAALLSGGITITVPSGSGIISDIADFAGDYKANVTLENIQYGDTTIPSVTVTMTTKTEENPVYLTACSQTLSKYKAANSAGTSSITDFFGYAIDLAFRTNAAESKLCLQTEPENRVYKDSTENSNLQGGGSYMEYNSYTAGISITKMIKLMSAIRIVFMDKEQNVLAIGVLDTTLGTDSYEVLSDEEKESTGKYAVINKDLTGVAAQGSDYITQTEYNALGSETAVIFDAAAKTVKAKLYLYSYSMTKSTQNNEDGTKLTGGITIGDRLADQSIMSLQQNEPAVMTALVYLDGSIVNNSMVAADSAYSMTGILNLQFSSDATLLPAENSELRTGNDSETANAETSDAEEETTSEGATD